MDYKYKVKEIFYGIVSGGFHAGKPFIFIRLAGCNLSCDFCDTLHNDNFVTMTGDEIVDYIREQFPKCKNVIITGGEPTIQDIGFLIVDLHASDYYVALETNGTNLIKGSTDFEYTNPGYYFLPEWIIVSPKKQSGYKVGIPCNELLFVVNDDFDENIIHTVQMLHTVHRSAEKIMIFLQPQNNEPKYLKKALELIKNNPSWRLSLQINKMVNLKGDQIEN